MDYLLTLDWIWIFTFLFLMIGSGIAFYRLASRSEDDYFLAQRDLPWWLPGISVYATHTATDTAIFVMGVVYLYGVSALWYIFFPVWVAVSAFISTRIFRRSLAGTVAEWQTLRFNGLGAEMLRGWVSGWQFFMAMFILGWVGAAMGKITFFLFGWPQWIGIVGFTSLAGIYVLMAGYWGVMIADFQQGIIAFALILIVSVWAIIGAGGPAEIIQKVQQMNSTYTWTVPDDTSPSDKTYLRITGEEQNQQRQYSMGDPFSIVGPPADTDEVDKATPTYEEMFQGNSSKLEGEEKDQFSKHNTDTDFNIVFPHPGDTLISGESYKIVWNSKESIENQTIEWSNDGGTSWSTVATNVRKGQDWRLSPFKFSGWFTGDFPVMWFLTMLVIATLGGIGIGTNSDWYVEAQRIQSSKTVMEASFTMLAGGAAVLFRNGIWIAAMLGLFTLVPQFADVGQVETMWYTYGFEHLPVGVVGLFVAGIIAIHLSTISTRLNLGAQYATRDLYHHYIKPDASEKNLVWVGRISTLVLMLGSFLYGMMITEITEWLIFAMWIMFAGIWLPSILQVVWWRFNAWGYLSAWIANLVFSWLIVWVLPAYGIIPELTNYMQFWILLALGTLVFIPITLLTKPEPLPHLVKFYVQTRPIGWWGPVKEEAKRQGLI
ncbi:Sodium:solute symporter family protein [Fodinibius roseus]|uniref:Sodium:solute symporter family protein n=1 Tax=Fodinibius roseus TaxID=1194090 RepID=A0A1M5M2Y5_9BACT|nr:hypothetical protein [Fodinibius roseus]SHG71674.1 Sodium:solute symporter family protein [Fodinibius roseus]